MKKLLLVLFALAMLFPWHSVSAATAQITISGPRQVRPGQVFQVFVAEQGFRNIDTIRLNGSFSAPLLTWDHVQAQNIFQNISPGTTVNQSGGQFSFGAFSYSSLSASGDLAVLTFQAGPPGTAKIALDKTSHAYANGESQPVSLGSLTVVIAGEPVASAPATVGSLTVRSSSNPQTDQWYPNADIDLSWSVLPPKPHTSFVSLDQNPQGKATGPVSVDNARVHAASDGVWYAHVKVLYEDGTSDQVNFPVRVDQTPPGTMVPIMDQALTNPSLDDTVRFAAPDATSGIRSYDVYIDGVFVTSTSLNAITFSGYGVGIHTVRIVAHDQAGNTTEGATTFEVIAEGPSQPVVTPIKPAPPLVYTPTTPSVHSVWSDMADWWYLIMMIFLVIAGVTAFIFEKKTIHRKRR